VRRVRVVLCVVTLALAGACTSAGSPLAETPAVVVVTLTPVPTPVPPSPTPVPPTLTPVPPSPTPVPSATPIPAVPLHVNALLDPATPRAGEDFTLALTVGNDGSRAAEGVYIATSGPWDQWTVLGIEPSGTFDKDAAGWHIISDVEIPPGESRTIQLHVRADQPAQEQLTFAVREATPGELGQ